MSDSNQTTTAGNNSGEPTSPIGESVTAELLKEGEGVTCKPDDHTTPTTE